MDKFNRMPKNKVLKFLYCAMIFISMYKDGFYFSKLTSRDSDGTRWGFYRFNFTKDKFSKYSLMDIDFSFGKNDDRISYFDAKSENFRWEEEKKK